MSCPLLLFFVDETCLGLRDQPLKERATGRQGSRTAERGPGSAGKAWREQAADSACATATCCSLHRTHSVPTAVLHDKQAPAFLCWGFPVRAHFLFWEQLSPDTWAWLLSFLTAVLRQHNRQSHEHVSMQYRYAPYSQQNDDALPASLRLQCLYPLTGTPTLHAGHPVRSPGEKSITLGARAGCSFLCDSESNMVKVGPTSGSV